MINAKQSFYKNSDHVSRLINNRVIIVLIKDEKDASDRFLVLNDTGSRIWSLLDGKRNAKDISEILCKEFDVSKEEAEKEILSFFEELLKARLILPLNNKKGGDKA